MKVLSELVAAAISVSCGCTIFMQSQSICLMKITQSCESPVQVLPESTANTFKDSGYLKSHHWYIPDLILALSFIRQNPPPTLFLTSLSQTSVGATMEGSSVKDKKEDNILLQVPMYVLIFFTHKMSFYYDPVLLNLGANQTRD